MRFRRSTVALRDAFRLLLSVSPRATWTLLVLGILAAAFYPALLLLVASLLDAVLGDGGLSEGRALEIALLLLGLVVLEGAVTIAADSITAVLRARVTLELTTRLMEKLAQVPYHLFEDNEFQGSYGLMVRSAAFRVGELVRVLVAALVALLGFLAVAATLLALAPLLIVLFAVALGLGLVEARYYSRIVEVQTGAAPELLRMQYLTQGQVDAAWQRDLRVYSASVLEDEYSKLGADYLRRLRAVVTRYSVPRLLASAGSAVAVAGAVWWLVTLVSEGSLSPSTAAVLLPGLYVGLVQARSLASATGMLLESLAYSEQLNAFLERPFEVAGRRSIAPAETSSGGGPSIAFEDVCFAYPDRERPALERVSLVLEPGVTAIVGPNGAGKSTLVKLLAGLLEPGQGSIHWGGFPRHDARAVARAVLFQEPSHLALTVRENVAMTAQRGDVDDPAIWGALERAGLRGVVERLPAGLDAVLGAGFGGMADLSGGEWQRLALARLLYHEAPLILLDEPVASMDADGERETFAVLRRLAASRIVVFTTHRYDSLQPSDRVLMLVDGRLAESGTHGALLEVPSAYRELVGSRGRS